MLKDKLKSGFGLSLALHAVIITIAFISIGFTVGKPQTLQVNLHPEGKENEQVIKAGVIDKKAVDQAYQRQQLEEKKRKQILDEEKKLAEQAKQDAAKAKAESEAAQKALEAAKLEKAKAEAEAKKLQAAQEKAKQEFTKQQEQAKKELSRQQELARKQETERKAQAIKAEQEKLKAQRDAFIKNEVQRYVAQFAQAIEDNRIISSIFEGDIICKIRIQLLPDGSILSASVVSSSGNPAYDEMSKNAVFKTAPFPMPEDKDMYERLRDIVLSFRNADNA